MKAIADAAKRTGWLTRLRRDQSGNTIAMFAAAVFPLAGLIGGGLDMSRIYLTRTRLQAACDAGALAGRKQMGTGTWAANSNRARTEATRMFNLNFASNSYGTTSTAPTFVENSGSVTGTASATIPMTIMRIFGSQDSTVNVSCNAAMSIPNTDIVFVLDTTGSMNSAPNGAAVTGSNPSKIAGLRRVVKCFYESLAKRDIASVSPTDCNEASNPSGGNAAGSQIRFGFVPYSSNVNVGKLLPNDFMVDSFTYQSRVAVLTPVWVYTLGSENAASFGAYNNPAVPSSPTSSYVSYTTTASPSINVNVPSPSGPTYPSLRTPTDCSGAPTFGASTDPLTAPFDTLNSTSSAAPVHPGGSATTSTHPYRTYTRTQPQVRRFYRYASTGSGSGRRCRLQYATANFDRTASGSSTRNIAWTQFTDTFTNWEYRPVLHNVSSLKAGGSNWNTTLALPTNFYNQTLNVSGTNGVSYKRVSPTNATWDGCIEERMTKRADSWDPYPTSAESPDLDLKSAPTVGNDDTRWKPSFNGGIWLRYVSGNKSQPTITSSSNLSTNAGYSCPSAARILTEYDSVAEAANYEAYLDGLVPSGSTYHDIGMIWGARLVLPDGIFSANNQIGSTNGIDRNIIFMTDGDTDSGETANMAYGRPWWDRRQEVNTGIGPDETAVDLKINGRLEAICDQLTNVENITVWVVSYGGTGISAATKDRLKKCSTNGDTEPDGVHFFDASDTNALLASFKSIANAISQLRLTN